MGVKADDTECVETWDWKDRCEMPLGVTIKLRVWGSLDLKAKIAAAIEEILEREAGDA